jgi:folylpolyglutamate synthase/dihydrofolate synthase
VENHYVELSLREGISASPFEILTATAFHIFNEEQVQVGVVEVGLGGRLDATNILNNQAVSVISKIAKDHQSFLGNTLGEIALHKAGILRPNVPYIINPRNEDNVHITIDEYARDIGAGPRLDCAPSHLQRTLFNKQSWLRFSDKLRQSQQDNATLAVIAAKTTVESMDLDFRPFDIGQILWKSRMVANPGRLELIHVPPIFAYKEGKDGKGPLILVDGAHNPDAAKVLSDHVENVQRQKKLFSDMRPPRQGWHVTWVLAMTEGKEAHEYLSTLLRPGDNIITTTFGPVDGMPWVKPMDPKELLNIAKAIEPRVTGLAMPEDGVLRALCAAKHLTEGERPIVLTGSLYLVGDFHRELRPRRSKDYFNDPDFEDDRKMFKQMLIEEKHRVNQLLSGHDPDPFGQYPYQVKKDEKENEEFGRQQSEREKRRTIQQEIEALDRELERLAEEERRIAQSQLSNTQEPTDAPPSATNLAMESIGAGTPNTDTQSLSPGFSNVPDSAPFPTSPPRQESAKDASTHDDVVESTAAPSSEPKVNNLQTPEDRPYSPDLPNLPDSDPFTETPSAQQSSENVASSEKVDDSTRKPPHIRNEGLTSFFAGKLDADKKIKPLGKLMSNYKKPEEFYKNKQRKFGSRGKSK